MGLGYPKLVKLGCFFDLFIRMSQPVYAPWGARNSACLFLAPRSIRLGNPAKQLEFWILTFSGIHWQLARQLAVYLILTNNLASLIVSCEGGLRRTTPGGTGLDNKLLIKGVWRNWQDPLRGQVSEFQAILRFRTSNELEQLGSAPYISNLCSEMGQRDLYWIYNLYGSQSLGT